MLTAETFSNCLEYLFPCTGLIYVGAGNGSALDSERFSRISKLLAIEANDLVFPRLERAIQGRTGWSALKVLIGDDEAETAFYAASNPNESGLLNPDALKAVWRNLSCLEVLPQASTTLSFLLQHDRQADSYNWLSIDCLPSARILRGLETRLDQFDVIDVRVLDHAAGVLDAGCTIAECDALLNPLGFQMGFIEEATNPMVKRVVYVRDGRAVLKIHTERLKQHYQVEIHQLTQAKTAAEELAVDRAQQAEQAIKAKNEQTKLAQERQGRVHQLEQKYEQLEARQQLIDSELQKANFQLEMLKDILFRDNPQLQPF